MATRSGVTFLSIPAAALMACALLLQACGGNGNPSSLRNSGGARNVESKTVDDVLSDLRALAAPEGVDAEAFNSLKSALEKALAQSGKARFVSRPPMEESSRVGDLQFVNDGDGTYSLSWGYRNTGDYDQNGEVSVPDITPIAVNYLNSTLG